MKTLVRSSHNKAEEVITHAEEELALAKLIRRGADRDLVQAQKTIEDLSGKLALATENWKALCVDAKVDLQTQRANTRIDIQSVPVDLTC